MAHWTDYGKAELEELLRHDREQVLRVKEGGLVTMDMGAVREDIPLNVRIERLRRAVDVLEGHLTGHDVGQANREPVNRPRESMEVMITSMGEELAGLEGRIMSLAEMLHRQVARL